MLKVRAVCSLDLVLIAGEVGDSVWFRFYFQVLFLCFTDFLCMYKLEWERAHWNLSTAFAVMSGERAHLNSRSSKVQRELILEQNNFHSNRNHSALSEFLCVFIYWYHVLC